MDKPELLLPAGDKDGLRAAVANGADAVYLGLDAFNARGFAANFKPGHLPGVVRFCHAAGVKVFVTANVLVKNDEMGDYLGIIGDIGSAGADAVIVQDPWLIPYVREMAPHCEVHVSTQAAIQNTHAIPGDADRVILPRELSLEEIGAMAREVPVEVFVHGALCLSYSGQCLFSSMAGGRSGNRGRCAQPCRQQYNGKFPLSTKDLCLLEKLPDIIATGARSLKVEGRMRGPLYAGTVARIYRKYIDMAISGNFELDPNDLEDLAMAFNRDFTTGFAFNDSIVDSRASTNRGLYLGKYRGGQIKLERRLRVGDGVMALGGARRSGNAIKVILRDGAPVESAAPGETVTIEVREARDGDSVYKNLDSTLTVNLGNELELEENKPARRRLSVPEMPRSEAPGQPMLMVMVHSPDGLREARKGGADVIYYDAFDPRAGEMRERVREAKFFLSTPRVMGDGDIAEALDIVREVKPDGVLTGERGMLAALKRNNIPVKVHLGQGFNVFNDIDLASCGGVPIISPELSLDELAALRSRRFMVQAHGPMVLMTTKEPIQDDAMVDGQGRRFRVRSARGVTEILNCSQLGMFNMTRDCLDAGIKWFYLDLERDVGKLVKVYRKIVSGEDFDDARMRKGYTTGHLRRGVQ